MTSTASTAAAAGQEDFYRIVADLGSATLHEAAGQIGALPSEIRSRTPRLALIGPAFPVTCPPADNLWLHKAVYAAAPGDVIVADVGGEYEAGYWGEVLSYAARSRGLAGLVIDGGVRDQARLDDIGVPVFSRRVCMRGTTKSQDGNGRLKSPVTLGGVVVRHGDLVVGDTDGVVVLPADLVPGIVAAAQARQLKETEYISKIQSGYRTLDLYGLET